MSDDEQSPFVAGATVALVFRYSFDGGVLYREATIKKVYANGNFVLKGSRQQYRPQKCYGEWRAFETSNSYGSECVEPITESLKCEVAASLARDEYRRLHTLLCGKRLPPHKPSEDMLRAMRELIDKIESE
jgi:hypothetical protein